MMGTWKQELAELLGAITAVVRKAEKLLDIAIEDAEKSQ